MNAKKNWPIKVIPHPIWQSIIDSPCDGLCQRINWVETAGIQLPPGEAEINQW
jgi:hypothetical protein